MSAPILREIKTVNDDRGSLSFLQRSAGMPFDVRRLFYLHAVAPGQARGDHAHREQHQFLIPVSGSFEVLAEGGWGTQVFELNRPSQGLWVPPMNWLKLSRFTPHAVCLVLCSEEYSEADYIRDHAEFSILIEKYKDAGER